jgi:multimeric flavodoxin WrbA
MHAMLDAVRRGANDPAIEGVEVVVKAALEATVPDVLAADGYVIGSPVNLGYISGALKHFFDTIYYPCIESTIGRPFGVYLHGNNDATGARRAVEAITTGLRWKRAAADVVVTGAPSGADLDACTELGATLAATLAATLL